MPARILCSASQTQEVPSISLEIHFQLWGNWSEGVPTSTCDYAAKLSTASTTSPWDFWLRWSRESSSEKKRRRTIRQAGKYLSKKQKNWSNIFLLCSHTKLRTRCRWMMLVDDDLTSTIQNNIGVIEQRRREIQEFRKHKEHLIKELYIPAIDLKATPVNPPRTVCAAHSCVKYITIEGIQTRTQLVLRWPSVREQTASFSRPPTTLTGASSPLSGGIRTSV